MENNEVYEENINDSYEEEMPDFSTFLEDGETDESEEGEMEDFFNGYMGEFEDDEPAEDEPEEFLPEFYILWNAEKDFYYLTEEGRFFVYTDVDFPLPEDKDCVSKTVECSMQELFTSLYNNGFFDGYLDNKLVTLKKSEILYLDRNPNTLYYNRYLDTKDNKWLSKIQKNQLWTLCKVTKQNEALFAIVTDSDTNDSYLLAFTDKKSITAEIKQRYSDFVLVRNPLLAEPYLLNFETPVAIEEKED